MYSLVILICMVILLGCGNGGSGNGNNPDNEGTTDEITLLDYSGIWYLAIGHSPRYIMEIEQIDDYIIFTITGNQLTVMGNGYLDDSSLNLSADLDDLGKFGGSIVIQEGGDSILGNFEIIGNNPISGSLYGTKTKWPEYDIRLDQIPRFINSNCIDLDKIAKISRFRSGYGHDYSDDFESCRSMKHYFEPGGDIDLSTIKIFSPVNGTIIGFTEEWDGPDLWKGTAVGIKPDGYEAFCIVLFHIDLIKPPEVGDRVLAGQELGTSEKVAGTASEISIEVRSPEGVRLISFFEIMTDDLFSLFWARGILSREATIITKEERDADTLSCNGEEFFDGGSLENMLDLNDALLTSLPCDSSTLEWIQPYGDVDHGGDNIFFHDGFDFGSPNGKFYSSANGIVKEVDLNTGKGWPGTNYRIVIEITKEINLDYHFEIGGEALEDERKANILVTAGDWIRAGQHIGNLISINDDVAHVHWGVYAAGATQKCPLDYFTPSLADDLEALYDSGIEKRPNNRFDLCKSE